MTNIQKILEIGLEEYLERNKTIGYKQKVIKVIRNCKSDKLGAHNRSDYGAGVSNIFTRFARHFVLNQLKNWT